MWTIILIIVKNLNQSHVNWEEFLGILETLRREEAPSKELEIFLVDNKKLEEAKEIEMSP